MPQIVLRDWNMERERWFRANRVTSISILQEAPESLRQEYHRRFTTEWHRMLDKGEGECILKIPENAELVSSTLRHFDGERYAFGDFEVMPNHLHVLVTPHGNHELSSILHSWKGFSARAINKRMMRFGSVWQQESFDHIVRSQAHFERFQKYIADNPLKAALRHGEFVYFSAGANS